MNFKLYIMTINGGANRQRMDGRIVENTLLRGRGDTENRPRKSIAELIQEIGTMERESWLLSDRSVAASKIYRFYTFFPWSVIR